MAPPSFPDKPRRPSRASQRASVNYSLPISPAKPEEKILESATSNSVEQALAETLAQATTNKSVTSRRATISQPTITGSAPAPRRASISQAQIPPSASSRAPICQAPSLTPAPRRASISQAPSLTPAPRRASISQGQGGLSPAPRRASISQNQPLAASRRASAWAPLSATAENPSVASSSSTPLSSTIVASRRLSVRPGMVGGATINPELISQPDNAAKRLTIAPLNTSIARPDNSTVPPSPTRNWAPLSPSFGKLASSLPPSPSSPNGRTWGPLATPPEGSNKLSVPPSPGSQTWAPLATPIERSNGMPPSPNREYGSTNSKRVSTMPIGINFSLPNSPAKSAFSNESKDNKGSVMSSFSPYGSTTDQLTTFAQTKDEKQRVNELPYDNSDEGKTASRRWFKNRKLIWIGVVVVLLVLGGVGAGIFVLLSQKKKTSGGTVAGVVQSDPNDPSIFVRDPALKQSFYGMAYTPQNARYPSCEDGIDAVIEDIQLLSQLTTRIRIYGSDCNQASLVLEAIQKTKVNMTVFLTAWLPQVDDDPDNVIYQRQVDGVVAAIKKYGTSNIGGILIGNEFLMTGGVESFLISKMAQMKNLLATMNLDRKIPVGTADTGAAITTTLSQASDFILANIHSWFAGVNVDTAAAWVHNFASTGQPSSAALATNQPTFYIGETGWPTAANASIYETNNQAVAGISQLNTFLSTFVCASNQNITNGDPFSRYFYFEAFDEPWKASLGSVEPYWGLFDKDKKLKPGLELPDCSHP